MDILAEAISGSDIFVKAFSGTFYAVLRVLMIVVTAGFLVRHKVVTQEQIKALANITVKILLPCMIFSKIVIGFDPNEMNLWWLFPLSSVFMTVMGLLLGYIFFIREMPQKRNMLSMTSLQNAGYLIFPIGAMLYSGKQLDEFILITSLFILGMY